MRPASRSRSPIYRERIPGTGSLFESDIDLQACDRIEIELAHAGDITAVVISRRGQLFGCQFEGPESSATLSAVKLKSAVAPILSLTSAVTPARGAEGASAEPALDESPGDAALGPLQDIIDRSREQIARAAELSIDGIRIIVEYWCGRIGPPRQGSTM